MKKELQKYLVEFIGTFFLVFTIGACSTVGSAGFMTPLVIGTVLMVMVYAGGYISGGHYNPAVSLAAAYSKAITWKDWFFYTIFQLLGGAAAAFLICTFAGTLIPPVKISLGLNALIIAEFLFTFALCYVVLNTAVSQKTAGNSYYGLAIGSIVMVGAFAVGNICIGAFNPAVALSSWVMGSVFSPCTAILTAFVNLIAGLFAALCYKLATEE